MISHFFYCSNHYNAAEEEEEWNGIVEHKGSEDKSCCDLFPFSLLFNCIIE
jgi:hypothetical protein